ncbi:MAG: RtcB family protein [Sedimentisphaerales bacterium]|nr:RtcB family protein [Sedimentisphaerales bacterium]
MYVEKVTKCSDYQWCIEPFEAMRVPVVIFGDEQIIRQLDDDVYRQAVNVAALPGIVKASMAMPDAHLGYGFPIGGVAAFDPENAGIISAGGVGFDISCGVRAVHTNLTLDDIEPLKVKLADELARHIPAGLGSSGKLKLSRSEMDEMLQAGAAWAVEKGYGKKDDLQRTEENGTMPGAKPRYVSDRAKERQTKQVGTLGSGNHYLEVQKVAAIFDSGAAETFGLHLNDIVVSIHCGSRGLGHQIGTDFLPRMAKVAHETGIRLPERELVCAPIDSPIGRQYFGAMNCGINCALANRQVLTHLTRQVFADVLPKSELKLIYDVSHNTCKVEEHNINGSTKKLYVHRKGATRAFGPGHPSLPPDISNAGQPVLIGGTMGTASYILAGTKEGMSLSFGSACHGAGRAMSRTKATKKWNGKDIVRQLAQRDIIIRGKSFRGLAEEAPEAYKDVNIIVDATEKAGLAKKVTRLVPLICVKG